MSQPRIPARSSSGYAAIGSSNTTPLRAVDGQATAAALAAVAAAFGVRRHAVTLLAGASSRTNIVEVAGADPTVLDRLLGAVTASSSRCDAAVDTGLATVALTAMMGS